MTDTSARIAVGYVVRAKGIRGEVLVEPLTGRIERFGELREVFFERGREPERRLVIEGWRPDAPGVLVKFAGIDTPEEAKEVLAKGYVTIPRQGVPPPPEGAHYVFDLVGCQVVDDSGRTLGEVADVLAMPSYDLYVVRSGEREVLVPAVEGFVAGISVEERRVSVRGVEEFFR